MTEERQNPASPHELTLDPKTIDVLIANIISAQTARNHGT